MYLCLGGDGTLRVWDVSDGEQIAQYDCYEKKPVRCFTIFPNSTSKVLLPLKIENTLGALLNKIK